MPSGTVAESLCFPPGTQGLPLRRPAARVGPTQPISPGGLNVRRAIEPDAVVLDRLAVGKTALGVGRRRRIVPTFTFRRCGSHHKPSPGPPSTAPVAAKPDLFAKFQPLHDRHARIVESIGLDPLGLRIEHLDSPTQATIGGRPCILLGSNNYLGLTFEPAAIAAATEALRTAGTGTTGSRVANGSYTCHQALERQLAEFYGRRRAILFTTGYQANVGFISAIAGKDDILLIDSDSHASIYDGCKLGDATVYRFRHNDPQNLARRLERLPRRSPSW